MQFYVKQKQYVQTGQIIMQSRSATTMIHTSRPPLVVSPFIVVDFHTLLSSVRVLWWHGSSCQMCGWIRGVGCTLWQPIDVHSAELRLPARAPQHSLCQGHCAVSGSGRGSRGRYGSKLGTQFKPREFDNVPYWTACFESMKNFFFYNYDEIHRQFFTQLN